VSLEAHDIERIAVAVVELLEQRQLVRTAEPELVSAAEVARRVGRGRDWVYQHAAELGVVHLGEPGEGKRPRLGFPPDRLEAYVSARSGGVGSDAAKPAPDQARRRRRKDGGRSSVRLLPVSDGRKKSRE
jgi:hypothetical protein